MQQPPHIIDRALVREHLRRRPARADDFVTRLVLDDLSERLGTVTRTFSRALIMAPDGSVLPPRGESANGSFPFERLSSVLGSDAAPAVDPENLALPHQTYDLIVSILDLQAVNDVPGFLRRVRDHLLPDGLFLGATLGGSSLAELRDAFLAADAELSGGAFPRVVPLIEVRDAGALLQRAGFALPVADVESHTVRYADALALMREVKRLGASNPLVERPSRLATLRLLGGAARMYGERFADPDGRVRATLEVLWMSGWTPHESQQKPLAPGSAKVSLHDVLGPKG